MTRVSDPMSGSLTGAAANADRLGEAAAPAPPERSTIAIDTRGIEPSGREGRTHDSRAHEGRGHEARDIGASGGWNAYEVWRRFIKDARDRRKQQDSN